MSDTHQNQEPETSPAVEMSGQIMIAAIIVLFMVIVFILFLNLYAKWFWSRRQPSRQGAGRRRFVFAPNQDPTVALHNGLEASIIRSLPVVVFHPEGFKDGLECAVCLCEVEDGEKARLLPKCNHGFHLECIDMWFQSHSTCPLCRNTVGQVGESTKTSPPSQQLQEQSIDSSSDYSTESHSFPTNVLFWDNQTQLNTGASAQVLSASSSSSSNPDNGGMLVIDIPTQLSTTSEEMKSPTTTRLGQLRRLLSREKRPVIPSSPTYSAHVEQGEVAQSSN